MSRLSVQCLGSPVVQHGALPVAFSTRKTLALLLYLAVDGRAHSREAVSALFWPDSPARRARGTLRSTLALLRNALRAGPGHESATDPPGTVPHLITARDQLAFDFAAPYDLDCRTLTAAWSASRIPTAPGPAPAPDLLPRLQAAVALYRGDFLAGFSLPDAPEFDEWANIQRTTWHRRLSTVLARLSALQAEGGALDAALETAARWVAHDPLDEAAHRRLMQVHFAAGDRIAALQAYDACCAALAREMGTAPGAETAVLARRLRAGAPPRPRPAGSAPAGPLPTGETPLVGRSDEHAALAAAYYRAAAGAPQVVALTGEAGMGKTRLAGAFLAWAAGQGADVVRGQGFESNIGLPYQPLVDALRLRLDQENAPEDLLGDLWLAELSRLLPELRERYPDLPAPTGEDSLVRSRLFEAIARLGGALAQHAPLVLFLDDLQWADAASLDVLHYSVRRWAAAHVPVLVLVALRAEALQPAAPAAASLARWLAALEHELPVPRLALGPLPASAIHDLVWQLAAAPAEAVARLSGWLAAETGGWPFFLLETLKALVEQGIVPARLGARGAWVLDVAAIRWPAPDGFLAPAVRNVINARLARLGSTAAALLAAGAVLGQGCRFAHLCAVAALDESAGLAALDDLLAAELLRESGSGEQPGCYFFTHDKIRAVVYAEAGAARRRLFHQRAYTALAATAPAATLAHHAAEAGLAAAAVGHSLAAGDAALAVFAVRDALTHYQRARRLLAEAVTQDGPRVPLADQHRLYVQLGRACELTDDWTGAREVYDEMLAVARTAAEPAMECAALNRLAALAVQGTADLDPAALLAVALDTATAAGDAAGLADTEWTLAQMHFTQRAAAEAVAHGRRALAGAQSAGLPELAARSLNMMAYAELDLGEWPASAAHAREAATAYAGLGNRALEADSHCVLANALIHQGCPADGVAAARMAQAITRAIENTWGQVSSTLCLALGLSESGAYGEALAVAQEGRALAAEAALPAPMQIFILARLGGVYRALQSPARARAAHDEALALAAAPGLRWWFAEMVAAELCADDTLTEDWTAAAPYARQALAAADGALPFAGLLAGDAIAALAYSGALTEAADHAARFAAHTGANPRFQLAYERGMAAVAATRGDAAGALAHLQAALDLAQRLGLPGEEWRVAARMAALQEATGAPAAAADGYARAAACLRTLAGTIEAPHEQAAFLAAPPVRAVLARHIVP
jgi:DNA-binding SARP family transcriptional activator